jgi:hypothetical protein
VAKTLPLADFDKLKKVMGIAFSSDQDGERLSALDMANKMLRKYDTNWSDLIDRRVEVVQRSQVVQKTHRTYDYGATESDDNMDQPQSDDWRPGMRVALDELRGTITSDSFRATVNSIEVEFISTNYLTPGQRGVIWKALREKRARR